MINDLNTDISYLQDKLNELQDEREILERKHIQTVDQIYDDLSIAKTFSWIFGILAFIGFGGAFYFWTGYRKISSDKGYVELQDRINVLKDVNQELLVKLEDSENNTTNTLAVVDHSEPEPVAKISEPSKLSQTISRFRNQDLLDNGAMYYAVQVGSFKKLDLSVYSDNFLNFRTFDTSNQFKYTVGTFENVEDARKFRKGLLKIGFKDAFVASYKNNNRIHIENPI